jgi:hypothetical protein
MFTVRPNTPLSGDGQSFCFDNSICGKSSGSECCNIVVAGDIGPVLSQDGSAERVDFAKGDGFESCAFQSKAESSNAREQVEQPHSQSFRRMTINGSARSILIMAASLSVRNE